MMFEGDDSYDRSESSYKVSRARVSEANESTATSTATLLSADVSASARRSEVSEGTYEDLTDASDVGYKGSIPPFNCKEKASSKNGFLLPSCIKHILGNLELGYVFDEPVLVAETKYKIVL